eukprot:gene9892-2214_t
MRKENEWKNEFLKKLKRRDQKIKMNSIIMNDYYNLLKNNPNSKKSKDIKMELETSKKDKEKMVENMVNLTNYLENVESNKKKESLIFEEKKKEKEILLKELESLELNRNVLTDVLLVEIRIRDEEIEEQDEIKDKFLEEEKLLKEKNDILTNKLNELEETLNIISNTLIKNSKERVYKLKNSIVYNEEEEEEEEDNLFEDEIPKRKFKQIKKQHNGIINRIKFNNESSLFGTCSDDGYLKVFDSGTTELHSEYYLENTKGITNFSFSKDLLLGTTKEGFINIWNLSNSKQLFNISAHSNEIFSSEFIQNDVKFITCGNDKKIKFWNESKCYQTFQSTHSALDISISNLNSNLLSSSHKEKLNIWDIRDYKLQNVIPTKQFITSINISKNDNYILINHQSSLELLDIRNFKIISQFSNDDYLNGFLRNRACFSPDSNYIAAGNTNGNILIWKVIQQSQQQNKNPPNCILNSNNKTITCVDWSKDGKQIISSCIDQSFSIFRI